MEKILLLDAPNFSNFLVNTFEGDIFVNEVKEVRQGFSSKRNKWFDFFFADPYKRRIDEDRFHELQKEFPKIKKYFIGPFHKCLRTKITFRIPENSKLKNHRKMLKKDGFDQKSIDKIMEEIKTRNIGELRVYTEFKNKDGKVPTIYNGFRPGVGYHNRNGVDYVSLVYGNIYAALARLNESFTEDYTKEMRGKFWRRYDGHTDIPFP